MWPTWWYAVSHSEVWQRQMEGARTLAISWCRIRSLVVVSRDTATQPFGIVVLGTDGRLARIDRTLWVAAAAERNGTVCGPGVESRGQSLEDAWVHAKAGGGVWVSVNCYTLIIANPPPDPQSYAWLGTTSRENRPSMRVVVGLCWARVGTILGLSWAILGLGHSGPRWHQNGTCWAILGVHFVVALAFVRQELGPHWAYFGPLWNILVHVGTILGSWRAILAYFGIYVGLCLLGFGHSSVVGISSMQGVCKKHHKYQEQTQFWTAFWLFLFLSWGMLHLGYACLISGLCWAIVGYVSTILGSASSGSRQAKVQVTSTVYRGM